MMILPSARKSRLSWCVGFLLCGMLVAPAVSQTTAARPATEASPIKVRSYSIDLTLDPAHYSLTAKTLVNFTALQNATRVLFRLNPVLHVASIADDAGKQLEFSQQDGMLAVTPAVSLAKGNPVSWAFAYSGVFEAKSGNTTRLASIGDPVSYLLYRADWFPVAGDGLDRFAAVIHVHVPSGERVLGSGPTGQPSLDPNGDMVFDFNWPHPGFPGTIIAGKFQGPIVAQSNSDIGVYLIDRDIDGEAAAPQLSGEKIAATAAKQFDEFASQFGPTESGKLNVVELPDGTLPADSAPEIATIAADQLRRDRRRRLLANTIAHQWWGNQVSPATLDYQWITNGMCRYAELQYLQQASKAAVVADAILNVSASALAYDGVPLRNADRYPEFSPQFEALTYDKGAMIFRMLHWQIGDIAFEQTLHGILSRKVVSAEEVERIAEAASHQNLRPFFTQWLDDTGAPTLIDKWTLYRLGNNKGFRVVGEIDEDLDLFQMPIEVRVETEGKTVVKRVEVMDPQTQFSIDTFGIPRKVSLDPERRLFRNDTAVQVRAHVIRGLEKLAENDGAGAVGEYRAALALDATSSLASYRLGEAFFRQRNYQAAEDAFRAALNGDGIPKWTEVWSDLELGKIFDASGQRDRAINQYREAIANGDNTSGALTLAADYLKRPYAPSTVPAHP